MCFKLTSQLLKKCTPPRTHSGANKAHLYLTQVTWAPSHRQGREAGSHSFGQAKSAYNSYHSSTCHHPAGISSMCLLHWGHLHRGPALLQNRRLGLPNQLKDEAKLPGSSKIKGQPKVWRGRQHSPPGKAKHWTWFQMLYSLFYKQGIKCPPSGGRRW